MTGRIERIDLRGAKCRFAALRITLDYAPHTPRKSGVVISGSRIGHSFSYLLKEVDNRILIEDTCKESGASKLVSIFDGSLEEWEEKHSEKHDSEEES